MNHAPNTANATFCATLCDQWWAEGLRSAFVAPGSRSTPLALALVEHPSISVEMFHDERSASFAALGYALATGLPGLVLCSSGTAGAHFYAAVIEAEASAVPMIVCTADRPPELWGRGAPQTIDQTRLFGDTVRDFVEPGPPDDLDPATWRRVAQRLWTSATGSRPGPVHANLSFRDPLTGTPGQLPPALRALPPVQADPPPSELVDQILDRLGDQRGVMIIGRHESDPTDLLAIADVLEWPVIADHRSGCRHGSGALQHFDAILREPAFADAHFPEVVLRVGEIVASKATSKWLSRCGADVLASRPNGRLIDPEDVATLQFDEAGVFAAVAATFASSDAADATDAAEPQWRSAWLRADAIAAQVLDAQPIDTAAIEIQLSRRLVAEAPAESALVVSSSMPIRDVEWFAGPRPDLRVFANRGANGIDGVVATAIGVALTGACTTCLIGDVAFLHDASSLTALGRRDIDLTIVVIDNDGGGIFSFLPQHDLLDTDTFETLFGTPHGTDIVALARAHNLPVRSWGHSTTTALLWPEQSGPRLVVVQSTRANNLESHNQINAKVGEALRAAWGR